MGLTSSKSGPAESCLVPTRGYSTASDTAIGSGAFSSGGDDGGTHVSFLVQVLEEKRINSPRVPFLFLGPG